MSSFILALKDVFPFVGNNRDEGESRWASSGYSSTGRQDPGSRWH